MRTVVLWIFVLALLVAASSTASYLRLLMRRLSPGASRKLFQADEAHRVRADRERVGVTLSALHGAAMALFAVGVTGLFFWQEPQHVWGNLVASLAVVLSVIAICDQLIPFVLVARHDEPDEILERWVPALKRAIFLALPLTFPILISTTIARLLEPMEPKPEEASPQEELQEFIEAGEEEGTIQKAEGEMLQSVVDFKDKVVRELMTPRPEIAALEINSSIEELRRLFREKRLTRYLVYSGQLDHVEGIVSVRDLMELPPEEQSKVSLRSLVRPIPFVPETKPLQDLLKELQQSTTQMAVVIDEYGSVAGLVTVEDLVEEIVGEIRDEVEPHAKDIVKESANSYVLAGQTELSEIAEKLNVSVEGGDYSTVAGLVLAQLGHVPARGEKVEQNGVTFEVLEANQRTVVKVRLSLPAAAPPPSASHAGSSSH